MSAKPEPRDPMMSTMVVNAGWRPAGYKYRDLDEFFPFYMSQHANRTCRRLHFVGTTLGMLLIGATALWLVWWFAVARGGAATGIGVALAGLALAHVQGYAFAWVGHFFFEHNKPATFQYPRLSYLGDYRMWWQILNGKIEF